MTYGDGVCDVDMEKLLDFHRGHGKVATLTAVMQEQQKGVLDIDGDRTVFEREPLERLAADNELMSYMHRGFWQCMDSMREKEMLEGLLEADRTPWKKWED